MLHSLLFTSFDDAARQAQYEAVQAALEAEPTTFPTVLLGNFEVEGEVVDALVVRPHSVTVLLFVPQGGLLDIANSQESAWQLGPYLLQGDEHAANPFEQFLRQQEAVATWLNGQLPRPAVLPELITGLVLFAGSVQFGPGVETYLRRQPGAENFQLLSTLAQLPRRLRQLHNPEISLAPDDLLTWVQTLTISPGSAEASENELPAGEGNYWEQKARQLWRWLGAEDIPHDAPYGSAAEAVAASQQEMRRLEHLSQQVRTELTQQRQEMEAREAEREQRIEQLRAQLTQTPNAAAEVAALQARLATETREKNLLEEAIRAAQLESAARNQEMDARIQQLGHLIQQLQTQPAPPAPVAASTPAASTAPVAAVRAASRPAPTSVTPAKPAPQPTGRNLLDRPSWRVQWPRVAIVAAVVLGGGLGVWGLVHVASRRAEPERTAQTTTDRSAADEQASEVQAPTLTDIQPDMVVVNEDTEDQETQRMADSLDRVATTPPEEDTDVTDSVDASVPAVPDSTDADLP
ncbi:hypothetical protein [Hymenobacter glacieicola]|uniref:NERD domain-containing protein n=1 Tax=Hymenobacter glacieicola TaxID=1562124 RepID=A0ABQ1X026_9BACT|nr:hypothetical protein [Hymenobacter glacieicola]GGG53188.1 hypothetical protein GCM10011378_31810 [Hymenobacter glacieicola]